MTEQTGVTLCKHVKCSLISVVYFGDKAVQEAGHTSWPPGSGLDLGKVTQTLIRFNNQFL
jgi:hypothetical protein